MAKSIYISSHWRTENSSQELEILSYERIKSLVNINGRGRLFPLHNCSERKQGDRERKYALLCPGPNLT